MSEWKKVKLGDLFERVTRKNTNLESDNVLTISAQYGLINQEEFFNKYVAGKNLKNYYLLKKGEFAYNKSYSAGYPMGATKMLEKYDEGVVSTLYICFRSKSDLVNNEYFKYYFESTQYYEELSKITQEGARNHGLLNINVDDFFDIQVILPPIKEQEKIMKILKNVEYLISMNKQYIQNIIKVKEKIFDNFLNQDFEWKNIPFSEVFDIIPNNSFSRDKLNYKKGTYKNIHYGDILTKYNEIINVEGNDDIPFINNEEIKDKEYVILKDGDVIIADTAEDESVGRAVELRNIQCEKVLSGLHTIACRPKLKFVSGYLGFYINSKEYHKQLIHLMQGIKVLGITKNNIKTKTTIKFPNLEIQHKITLIMENSNEKIKLLERKMEEYENIKKGLMQKLLTGKVKVNV